MPSTAVTPTRSSRKPRCPTRFAVLMVAATGLAGCAGTGSALPSGAVGSDPAAAPSAQPAVVLPSGPLVGAARGDGLLFTARADAAGTVVSGLDRNSRAVVGQVRLDGAFRFPVVAPKAPVEGVSHDGRVVVLAGSDAGRSQFAVLDGALARPVRVVTLPAGFSYDALSPDGSVLYLVEHLPPSGSEHYQVRAYDLATGRLAAGAIADKSAVPEQMAGHPLARATSPDGDWVATLYERTDGEAFIHLLAARNQFALCLDLPPGSVSGWGLRYQGDRLTVHDARGLTRLTERDNALVPAR